MTESEKTEPYREGDEDPSEAQQQAVGELKDKMSKEDQERMQARLDELQKKAAEEMESDGEKGTPEEPPADAAPEAEGEAEAQQEIPQTAVLVVRFDDGRIEAVTTLPGMNMKRKATLRDVRDMAAALHDDTMATMVSQAAAQTLSQSLGQAMAEVQKNALKDRIQAQMAGMGGRPRQ